MMKWLHQSRTNELGSQAHCRQSVTRPAIEHDEPDALIHDLLYGRAIERVESNDVANSLDDLT